MSALICRTLLETALAAISPALATAYENMPFTPTVGTPYQRVHVLLADPDPIEMSGHFHREHGFMQVTLCYPLDAGSGPALTRAELIRSTFYRGKTLSGSGVTLMIERHPEIAPAITEDDRYVVPVRVRFFANIERS